MGHILNSLWALGHSHVFLLSYLSKSLESQTDAAVVFSGGWGDMSIDTDQCLWNRGESSDTFWQQVDPL